MIIFVQYNGIYKSNSGKYPSFLLLYSIVTVNDSPNQCAHSIVMHQIVLTIKIKHYIFNDMRK